MNTVGLDLEKGRSIKQNAPRIVVGAGIQYNMIDKNSNEANLSRLFSIFLYQCFYIKEVIPSYSSRT